MNMLLHYLKNEARLSWYLRRRYWFESILALALVVAAFIALLFIVVSASEQSLTSGALDSMIVSFALWLFAVSAYSSASNDIAEETRQRTLEQIYLSPLPLATVLALRTLLNLLEASVMLAIAMTVIFCLTDGRLRMNAGHVFVAALIAAPALVGVGYFMAGIQLLVKKAEVVHALVYPALIGLVALPAYPVNLMTFLPFALGAASAKAAAVGESLPLTVFSVVAVNSLIYLLAGIYLYALAERQARRLGILGHF